ncbi:MAG: hypothetical protein ACETWE_02780 [Candidatus Bathyarchaeia archaeon]
MKYAIFSRSYGFIGMFFVGFLVLASLVLPVQGQSASIVLSPDKGVSAITIEGSGFNASAVVTVYWDGQRIPTLPLHVSTDEAGAFSCIISAYNQTSVGAHEVKAVDSAGIFASATFTVIDVTGPRGEQGPLGAPGEAIPPGYLAGWLLLAAAIGGLMGVFLGRRRGEREEEKAEMISEDADPLQ